MLSILFFHLLLCWDQRIDNFTDRDFMNDRDGAWHKGVYAVDNSGVEVSSFDASECCLHTKFVFYNDGEDNDSAFVLTWLGLTGEEGRTYLGGTLFFRIKADVSGGRIDSGSGNYSRIAVSLKTDRDEDSGVKWNFYTAFLNLDNFTDWTDVNLTLKHVDEGGSFKRKDGPGVDNVTGDNATDFNMSLNTTGSDNYTLREIQFVNRDSNITFDLGSHTVTVEFWIDDVWLLEPDSTLVPEVSGVCPSAGGAESSSSSGGSSIILKGENMAVAHNIVDLSKGEKATIIFNNPVSGQATIEVVTRRGKSLGVIYSGTVDKGVWQLEWDGKVNGVELAPGVYMLRVKTMYGVGFKPVMIVR